VAALAYLDTHVAAWLYAGLLNALSTAARRVIEQGSLVISPAVVLELQYLFETNRTTEPADRVVQALQRTLGVQVCEQPFPEVVSRALSERWTRDPFDRLIVSQAALRDAALLTKDRGIRKHYDRAIW
jgi:PIN domain nuclease of toxin-antitoxin system